MEKNKNKKPLAVEGSEELRDRPLALKGFPPAGPGEEIERFNQSLVQSFNPAPPLGDLCGKTLETTVLSLKIGSGKVYGTGSKEAMNAGKNLVLCSFCL